MKKYTMLLQDSGLKATFQRINILHSVDILGHLSIDNIYAQIINSYPHISLATIYKNILLMVEKDILIEVPISGDKSQYELNKEKHIHLICTKCKNVTDIKYDKTYQEIIDNISNTNEFSIYTEQTNFYGLCALCKI